MKTIQELSELSARQVRPPESSETRIEFTTEFFESKCIAALERNLAGRNRFASSDRKDLLVDVCCGYADCGAGEHFSPIAGSTRNLEDAAVDKSARNKLTKRLKVRLPLRLLVNAFVLRRALRVIVSERIHAVRYDATSCGPLPPLMRKST